MGEVTETVYCQNVVLNNQWINWLRQPSDGPAYLGDSWGWWASCWSWWDRVWKDGQCLDSERFLNESCWDGFWGSGSPGQCKSDDSYSEYAVPCLNQKCETYAKVNAMD